MVEYRQIGQSELKIAPIMLGGNVFGWTADRTKSFEILDAFVANGFNAIDTADQYSNWVPGHVGGESEAMIGEWMKARGQRANVVLATKLGRDLGDGKKGLSAKYIVQAAEASLRRLQTDYIDLYQSHIDDLEVPLGETLEAYEALVKAGKVRTIGASNYSAERLTEALEISRDKGLARYESLQPFYNLYERAGFEDSLQKVCVENRIGAISYYSLASGFFTGKYRTAADSSKTMRGGWVNRYLNERGFRILAALDSVAAQHQATSAQIALAWLIAQPGIAAPIVSATNIDQLTDILGAARVTLDAKQMAELDTASADEKVEA